MKFDRIVRAAVVLAAVAAPAAGQTGPGVGKTLGKVDLEGFTQTGAKSYGDLVGRTVLIEFFAYW